MMAVQDAKIKNIAKDLITGIGGLRIKDVIGNFRKGPAVKVGYLHLEKKVKKIFFFFSFRQTILFGHRRRWNWLSLQTRMECLLLEPNSRMF